MSRFCSSLKNGADFGTKRVAVPKRELVENEDAGIENQQDRQPPEDRPAHVVANPPRSALVLLPPEQYQGSTHTSLVSIR
jgi:hypothetical protein